jgi:NifB/MoaA-like Fe-S oxidoreductase
MATEPDNHTIEMLRRLRTEQNARFDRLDSTLAEVLTQIRIHGTHIAGLVQQENFTGTKVAEIESRLHRVEQRLDLVDPDIAE